MIIGRRAPDILMEPILVTADAISIHQSGLLEDLPHGGVILTLRTAVRSSDGVYPSVRIVAFGKNEYCPLSINRACGVG